MPNEAEVAMAIEEVLAGEPSMGDRIQGCAMDKDKEGGGFKLITEKTINLTKFFGEQDSKNQVPYMKWARQLKGFIETRGKEGNSWLKQPSGLKAEASPKSLQISRPKEWCPRKASNNC